MSTYLLFLGTYKLFYIFNWILRYNNDGFYEYLVDISDCVETTLIGYTLTLKWVESTSHRYTIEKTSMEAEDCQFCDCATNEE